MTRTSYVPSAVKRGIPMQFSDIPDDRAPGRSLGIRVKKSAMRPTALAALLRRVLGARDVTVVPWSLWEDGEVRVTFVVDGVDAIVWEPFGTTTSPR